MTGKDLQTSPNCFVVVDKRVINSEFLTPMKAILAAFMCHFVLKCTYSRKISAIMEFIQRFVLLFTSFLIIPYLVYYYTLNILCSILFRSIFEINAPGSRVERLKTAKGWECAPSEVNAKYLTIMREYEDFKASWEQPDPEAEDSAEDSVEDSLPDINIG